MRLNQNLNHSQNTFNSFKTELQAAPPLRNEIYVMNAQTENHSPYKGIGGPTPISQMSKRPFNGMYTIGQDYPMKIPKLEPLKRQFNGTGGLTYPDFSVNFEQMNYDY